MGGGGRVARCDGKGVKLSPRMRHHNTIYLVSEDGKKRCTRNVFYCGCVGCTSHRRLSTVSRTSAGVQSSTVRMHLQYSTTPFGM